MKLRRTCDTVISRQRAEGRAQRAEGREQGEQRAGERAEGKRTKGRVQETRPGQGHEGGAQTGQDSLSAPTQRGDGLSLKFGA